MVDHGTPLRASTGTRPLTCRMPRRVLETVLEQVLGTAVSVGNTQTCWEDGAGNWKNSCIGNRF